MNEASITAELIHSLRALIGGVPLKLSDRSTIGIPDIAWTVNKRTFWIEVKLVKLNKLPTDGSISPKKIEVGERVKLEIMKRLAKHGSAFYVIFINCRKQWWMLLIFPDELESFITQEVYVQFTKDEGKGFDRIASHMKRMLEVNRLAL